MSKERELLERVISGDDAGDFFIGYRLYKDIETFLDQPEQEPVAWMSINNNGGISIDNYYANHKDYVPLYIAPPTREPLSEKEITKNTPKLIHIGERLAFHAGVRFAEEFHGIEL